MIAQIDEGILTLVKTLSEIGFAGAFGVAAWLCFWLIRARREDWKDWLERLIKLQEQTNTVVRDNTQAFQKLADSETVLSTRMAEITGYQQRVYERLLERPCLLPEQSYDKMIEVIHKARMEAASHKEQKENK